MTPSSYRVARVLVALVVTAVTIAGVAVAQGHRGQRDMVREREQRREAARAKAELALAKADTLLGLTRLVGIVPDRCLELDPETRVCSWEITNKMPGYRALAAIAGTTKRVFLVCELPFDNSERPKNSCSVTAPG